MRNGKETRKMKSRDDTASYLGLFVGICGVLNNSSSVINRRVQI